MWLDPSRSFWAQHGKDATLIDNDVHAAAYWEERRAVAIRAARRRLLAGIRDQDSRTVDPPPAPDDLPPAPDDPPPDEPPILQEEPTVAEPTPLQLELLEACRVGDLEAARGALKRGADPNASLVIVQTVSPLPLALAAGSVGDTDALDCCRVLVEAGAVLAESAVEWAERARNTLTLKYLKGCSSRPNRDPPSSHKAPRPKQAWAPTANTKRRRRRPEDKQPDEPPMNERACIAKGRLLGRELFFSLRDEVDKGELERILSNIERCPEATKAAAVTWHDGNRWTSLHAAAAVGAVPVCRRLLALGACPRWRTAQGSDVLSVACAARQVEVLCVLKTAALGPSSGPAPEEAETSNAVAHNEAINDVSAAGDPTTTDLAIAVGGVNAASKVENCAEVCGDRSEEIDVGQSGGLPTFESFASPAGTIEVHSVMGSLEPPTFESMASPTSGFGPLTFESLASPNAASTEPAADEGPHETRDCGVDEPACVDQETVDCPQLEEPASTYDETTVPTIETFAAPAAKQRQCKELGPRLLRAVKAPNIALVKSLLRRGAPPTYTRKIDGSALHVLLSSRLRKDIIDEELIVECAQLLVDADRLIASTVDGQCHPPLFVALKLRSHALTTLLLEVAPTMARHVAASTGTTAMHVAASSGSVQLVTLLINAGAPLDAMSGNGRSPMAIGARGGHLAVVKALLDAGATLRNERGDESALKVALERRHNEIVMMLLSANCPLSVKTVDLARLSGCKRIALQVEQVLKARRDKRAFPAVI